MAITILSSAQCRTDFNFVRTFTGSRFLFHCICAIRLRKFSQLYANMPQRLITIFIGTLFAESLYAQTFSELEAKLHAAEAEQSDQLREQTLAAMRAELVSLLHNNVRITKQRVFAQQRDKKYSQLADVIESEVGSGRTSVFRLAEVEAERAEVARTLVDLEAQTEQLDARLRYLVDEVPITTPPELNPADWSGSTQDFYATRVAIVKRYHCILPPWPPMLRQIKPKVFLNKKLPPLSKKLPRNNRDTSRETETMFRFSTEKLRY